MSTEWVFYLDGQQLFNTLYNLKNQYLGKLLLNSN